MRYIGVNGFGARVHQGFRRIAQRAAGIDDIVNQNARPVFYVTDDVHYFRYTGPFAAFVDNGEIGVQPLGECPGANGPLYRR